MLLLLLERGADVTSVDGQGATPLMLAADYGHDGVVRALLEHGGSEVDAATANRWTACHFAGGGGHPGVLRQLLEAGADPTMRDDQGQTASHVAAWNQEQECVRILQEWHRPYRLYRTRSFYLRRQLQCPSGRIASVLVGRGTSGLTMPTVNISTQQQHRQPPDHVGEEGHLGVEPVAVGGVVTVYAIEELNGEVFVELIGLMGITG